MTADGTPHDNKTLDNSNISKADKAKIREQAKQKWEKQKAAATKGRDQNAKPKPPPEEPKPKPGKGPRIKPAEPNPPNPPGGVSGLTKLLWFYAAAHVLLSDDPVEAAVDLVGSIFDPLGFGPPSAGSEMKDKCCVCGKHYGADTTCDCPKGPNKGGQKPPNSGMN